MHGNIRSTKNTNHVILAKRGAPLHCVDPPLERDIYKNEKLTCLHTVLW